jgi:hypothetical protein
MCDTCLTQYIRAGPVEEEAERLKKLRASANSPTEVVVGKGRGGR